MSMSKDKHYANFNKWLLPPRRYFCTFPFKIFLFCECPFAFCSKTRLYFHQSIKKSPSSALAYLGKYLKILLTNI